MFRIFFSQKEIIDWQNKYPILKDIIDLKPIFWVNSNVRRKANYKLPLSIEDMEEAELLWKRFAPFLLNEFPETKRSGGVIESPLQKIIHMQNKLSPNFEGELYLKCDNELPIAGSIKARGGIYEVLQHAESLAIKAGMLNINDNYEVFSSEKFKQFFSHHSIGVGSTGNLGLSIGTISSKLGFNVSVYMSADAKQWKKKLLREKGASVYEYSGDFSEAIISGRKNTVSDSYGYFVDDEDSKHLFLGYSVAALRLRKQLKQKSIIVDEEHPLFVYLPCGVGGSPGGITFGLKQVFGDHVHCFFVEPTHSPSVLIGLLTGEMENVSVQDFGIDNQTEADGLAVGRPSSFATRISEQLVSGIYTIEDNEMYKLLAMLGDSESIYLEPSATAGLIGPTRIQSYVDKNKINTLNATHIAWATGGSLVPEGDMKRYYEKGKSLL